MGRQLSDLESEANDVACALPEHVNQLQIDEAINPSLNGAGRHLALPLCAPFACLNGGAKRDPLLVFRTYNQPCQEDGQALMQVSSQLVVVPCGCTKNQAVEASLIPLRVSNRLHCIIGHKRRCPSGLAVGPTLQENATAMELLLKFSKPPRATLGVFLCRTLE